MNEHNQKRAERLFDAIGGIDDELIQDAMSPIKARERIASRRRMRISAVAAACLFCLVVGAILKLPDLGRMTNSVSRDPSEVQTQPSTEESLQNVIPSSLESTLSLNTDSAKITRISQDELDLQDDTPKLIWQFDGEEDYSVAKIKQTDSLNVITRELDRPASDLSAVQAEKISVRMWISYGDGKIISPYLKHTPGNTGMGVLFDYSAEVEPSAKLTQTILELIK